MLVVFLVILITNIVLFVDESHHGIRDEALKALQSTTLLFTVCAAMSIALLANYVRGLREAYLKRVSDIRDLLEEIFDKLGTSNNDDIKPIVDDYIIPLMCLNNKDWLEFEKIEEISKRMETSLLEHLQHLHARDKTFLSRYLLRIEDDINEITLLYIRRIASKLHTETASGSFILVSFGIIVLGFSHLLPVGTTTSILVVNISTAIITLAVIEVLLILSYFRQEAREERPEIKDQGKAGRT
jgi:hypothetical protein